MRSSGEARFKLCSAVLVSASLFLGGCAVIGSAPSFDYEAGLLGCQSTLGSYTLPKSVLTFKITKTSGQPYHVLQQIERSFVPDNQHTFCLDHLRSPTSSDEVRVFKNKIEMEEGTEDSTTAAAISSFSNVELGKRRKVKKVTQTSTPYLQLIASKAVDHTAGIIRRFIRTAFILLTNKGFTPARSSVGIAAKEGIVVADFTVDPFDYQEMARVNDVVRKFGFCFVLEDYTFDRQSVSADRYCRAPYPSAKERPPRSAEAIQNLHYLVQKPTAGVFYRPRAAYRLSVYVNDDPEGRGRWRVGHMKNLSMENIMPIVSVGVDRAIFATRRTGLVFVDGALRNVCISKGSEAESAIQIPLDVVYGIISLPSETIRATIEDTNTAKSLLEAQRNLITAQNNYIKFLNDPSATAASGIPTGDSTKKVPLSLGSTASNVTFADDDPPDAGPIYSSAADADALSEICAELAVTSTTNPGTTPKGSF